MGRVRSWLLGIQFIRLRSYSPPTPRIGTVKFFDRDCWCEGVSTPYGSSTGRNLYISDYDKYPEFGILYHTVEVSKWTATTEHNVLSDAIEFCRHEFGKSYSSDAITTYDHLQRHKNLWQNGVRVIPFYPRWVVVVVDNRAKLSSHPDAAVGATEFSEEDRARMIEVGYVFAAKHVFDTSLSVEEVIKAGFRDKHPVRFDFSAGVPKDEDIFEIIDQFKKQNRVE